jgi:hypothetical protein
MPLTKAQKKQLADLDEKPPETSENVVEPGEATLALLDEKIAEQLALLDEAEKTVKAASVKHEAATEKEAAAAKKKLEESAAKVSHLKSGLRNSIKVRDALNKPAKSSGAAE